MDDHDPPLGPADALALIEREQARTSAGLTPDLALMYGVWGAAYLVSGVVFYLSLVAVIEMMITVAVAVAVLVAAIAVSIVASRRGSRGIRTGGDVQGALYGAAWSVVMILTAVLTAGISVALPDEIGGRFTGSIFVFVVGLLFVAGGVAWVSRTQYGVGMWTMLVATAGVFVPVPLNVLVLSIGAGGGFVALAVWFRFQLVRRVRG